MLTYQKRQPVLIASAEEATPRISKRKRTNVHAIDDSNLPGNMTVRATRGGTPNPSKNPTNKKAGAKPPKPSLRAAKALQVAKAEVLRQSSVRT